MTTYVALLRAVNVGGTGKLPMAQLRAICAAVGFGKPRTYIASGNVLFDSDEDEAEVKSKLEAALSAWAGRPMGALVRTAAEMAATLAGNPFAGEPGNRVVAIFLDAPPPEDLLAGISGRRGESIAPGRREIWVLYDEGMAQSRLRIRAAAAGTARNLNTVAKLAALASCAA